MLQFIDKIGRREWQENRKKHLAPFVAVLLGWETGLAKVSEQRESEWSWQKIS